MIEWVRRIRGAEREARTAEEARHRLWERGEWDHLRYAIGALHARQAKSAKTLAAAEFRSFSQFGEDGILQWLINRVAIERDTFVELGVGDYRESNTRFLLEHDNWRGLVIDSSPEHVRYLEESGLKWRHSVTSKLAWVTRENVNHLLSDVGGDIGLLSIDLDGIDYWVLEALTVASPRIVVVEYNGLWGHRPVSIPYDPQFDRSSAHWSWQYFGASLSAFCHLMDRRRYRLVGTNTAGHNAFFVRDDVAGDLPPADAQEDWVEARFRESRDEAGQLNYLGDVQRRLSLISHMPLVDVTSGDTIRVEDLNQQ